MTTQNAEKEKEKESTTAVMSELKRHSSKDGTNIIKEYKDIFSKVEGSDHKDDKVADEDVALSVLKSLVEEKKASITKEDKKRKWDFAASPHAHFGRTLDDTYGAFLAWARAKQDPRKVNVSKAFRRLESYADWMHETGTDLTEPALTPASVKEALDAWAFKSTVDEGGRLVWWMDMEQIDLERVKRDFAPEDHLRAFAWYGHALMYHESAQKNGMVIVENIARIGMKDCFTMMPMKLATKLDRLTMGVLPVKMQCCYMFESPTWINIFMKILGVFMSKKMKERMVFLKSWDDIDKIDGLGGLNGVPKGFGKVDGKLEDCDLAIEKTYFG